MSQVNTAKDVLTAIRDYDNAESDLTDSNHDTFGNNLKRFFHVLRNNPLLSTIIADQIPIVDFDSWYGHAKSTVRGPVGSGTLDWPLDKLDRLAHQMALLEQMTDGKESVIHFCHKFMYSENNFDSMVYEFTSQIVRPFTRDLRDVIVDATEQAVQAPEARTIDVPATDIGVFLSHNGADSRSSSSKVFVVHGHDDASKEKVARFLEKLQLEPIILHEQPNKGRTIIEKFTDYADVAYAVVLMTADDIGGVKGTATRDLSPRARQNVVLELGYFLAKLSRGHVCALYETGVEIPSDYSGVLYLTLDPNEAWRFQLAKELKAAGLPVDLNHAV